MQLAGANCECNGRVWRMDVGMSGGVLNALPQVSTSGLRPTCVNIHFVQQTKAASHSPINLVSCILSTLYDDGFCMFAGPGNL